MPTAQATAQRHVQGYLDAYHANADSVIRQAAHKYNVPPWVITGIYGAESSFGRAQSWFGLTGDYPGRGTSGNFVKDANRSAQIVRNLLNTRGSLEAALRAYSGGSYGTAHVQQLAHQAGASVGPIPVGGASPAGAAAAPASSSVNLGLKSSFDQQGFARAQKLSFLASYLQRNHAEGSLFRTGVLSTAAPNPQDFTSSQLTSKIVRAPGAASPVAPAGGPAPSGGNVADFGGQQVAGWIAPILSYARQHGWRGSVTSGYRSYQDQLRIYNSGVRPAAKPGTSNHEFTAFPGGAVDVSDAQTLAAILARSPYRRKLVWAGGKDPVHFSHPHGGGY